MRPVVSENLVGQLLVFAGIGFSILMGVAASSISRRIANTDELSRSRWYLRAIGGLVFVIPFYLLGTFATVIYIGSHWPPILIVAYWAVLTGTLLTITFFAYFALRDMFDMGWDYWRVRGVNKSNEVS